MDRVRIGRIKPRSFAYVGRIRVVLNGSETEAKDKGGGEGLRRRWHYSIAALKP
jgi:hypothetical protein